MNKSLLLPSLPPSLSPSLSLPHPLSLPSCIHSCEAYFNPLLLHRMQSYNLAFGSDLLLAILSISSSTTAWYSSSAYLEEKTISECWVAHIIIISLHINLCASISLSYCNLAMSALSFLSLIYKTWMQHIRKDDYSSTCMVYRWITCSLSSSALLIRSSSFSFDCRAVSWLTDSISWSSSSRRWIDSAWVHERIHASSGHSNVNNMECVAFQAPLMLPTPTPIHRLIKEVNVQYAIKEPQH